MYLANTLCCLHQTALIEEGSGSNSLQNRILHKYLDSICYRPSSHFSDQACNTQSHNFIKLKFIGQFPWYYEHSGIKLCKLLVNFMQGLSCLRSPRRIQNPVTIHYNSLTDMVNIRKAFFSLTYSFAHVTKERLI